MVSLRRHITTTDFIWDYFFGDFFLETILLIGETRIFHYLLEGHFTYWNEDIFFLDTQVQLSNFVLRGVTILVYQTYPIRFTILFFDYRLCFLLGDIVCFTWLTTNFRSDDFDILFWLVQLLIVPYNFRGDSRQNYTF